MTKKSSSNPRPLSTRRNMTALGPPIRLRCSKRQRLMTVVPAIGRSRSKPDQVSIGCDCSLTLGRVIPHDFDGAIVGTIVANDQLEVLERLLQNRLNGLGQEATVVK